jgi:acyl-CoA thioesterase FadM
MDRVKIVFPETVPLYETNVPVRISDVNYGGHLGNDAVLSLVHEARMQMLAALGFTELDCGGAGLIMADAAIAYKSEAFYGEVLRIRIYASEISTRSFSLLYRIQKGIDDVDVAHIRTGMASFDYRARHITAVPAPLMLFLHGGI